MGLETKNRHEISRILDKLTIDGLMLTEKYINEKLEIEKCMNDGEDCLIKNRYISRSSTICLPSENVDLKANLKSNLKEDFDVVGGRKFEFEQSEESNMIMVRRLFGVLASQPVRLAQEKFELTLKVIERCANIQIELNAILTKFRYLMHKKN